jgi:hypothetical protein
MMITIIITIAIIIISGYKNKKKKKRMMLMMKKKMSVPYDYRKVLFALIVVECICKVVERILFGQGASNLVWSLC